MSENFLAIIGLTENEVKIIERDFFDKFEKSTDSFEFGEKLTDGMSKNEKIAFIKGCFFGGLCMQFSLREFSIKVGGSE